MKIVKYSCLLTLFGGLMLANAAYAQQSPIVSSYFQNEYLFNAAQVGVNGMKAVDAIVRTPVGQYKGEMKENYVHAMYGFGRQGIGAGFRSNAIGAFNLSEINLSYALHLPLDGESRFLSMGTGVKFLREQINADKIVGDVNDPMIAYYNNDPNRFDINLGLAYTATHLSLNLAVNNILRDKHNFLLNPSPFIYSSIKYKFLLNDVSVQPVFAYRRLLNDRDVVDIGTSVGFDGLFDIYAFYHTSKNMSTGLSTQVKNLRLNLGYTTTTASVQGLAVQGLDIGVRYQW
ncbi:PorP/SprF family type IX secretion system membrane protein [Sphingobacterium olei]|nr:PorP/SprF family type IX secretion system membrane protein [Sphingobacterium olei]